MNKAFLGFDMIDIAFNKIQNPPRIIKKYIDKVFKEEDIKYSSLCNDCLLDMYTPASNKEKLPVVILIHGGGFCAGDKKYRTAQAYFIAEEAECIVLNINYGMANHSITYMETIRELGDLLVFINDHADDYRFDINNIAVCGDSAGATYSLQLCNLCSSDILQAKVGFVPPIKVKTGILDCGFYTFKDEDIKAKAMRTMLPILTGKTKDPEEQKQRIIDLNALNYVSKDICPLLLCRAKRDIFCAGQTEQLISILDELNLTYTDFYSKSLLDNHVFPIMWKGARAKRFNNLMIKYLKETFNEGE